jgi:lipopolysaccharide/colanic/teichoic acid biosynthesis glycosyltransferase
MIFHLPEMSGQEIEKRISDLKGAFVAMLVIIFIVVAVAIFVG